SPVAVAAPPARVRAGSRRAATAPAPRRAAPPRRDHLRVVAPASRARRARPVRRSVVAAAAATVIAVLAMVVFHVVTAQAQLTLDHVSHQVDDAQRGAVLAVADRGPRRATRSRPTGRAAGAGPRAERAHQLRGTDRGPERR